MQPSGPERGRLTVFLGMAAGVGKTFRMLREGVREAESGRDVVIGYLEPHDRPETAAQSEGLEVVPRLMAEQGLEEMDVDAVVRRAPELCLVDELAHTNAPGVRNAKRWQDVHSLIEAGIDVYTTMNVQHLESLNDQVAELTGTHVRETVPDTVLSQADEVLLIDVTPEALIERLQAGKIYPAASVPSALNNFFKIENLTALRSVALRQVADDVEAKRLTVEHGDFAPDDDRLMRRAMPIAVGERALALVKPGPNSQRILRRAWRSAQRLGCELDALWVAPPDREPTADEQTHLTALGRLTSVLGAQLHVVAGDDVADVVREFAREHGSTYVLLGPPSPRSRFQRWTRPSLVDRILNDLPGADIRVIADRSKLGQGQ